MPKQFNVGDLQHLTSILIALIPIGTAALLVLGVAFDIGFFAAIDINFVTFFSLSEHVVFALQALPQALAILLFAPSAIWMTSTAIKDLNDRGTSSRAFFMASVFVVLVVLGVLVAIGLTIYNKQWLAVAFIILMLGCIFMIAMLTSEQTRTTRVFLMVVSSLISIAFIYGYISGFNFRARDVLTHEIRLHREPPFNGRIVGSGSTGVLLIDGQRRPVFKRWDSIVDITSKR